ncbi:MAG: proton-conducting transporter membrane subunit, partial [Acidimicrobiales bacterium]|nr:proton-conducting transporter membrane subunit [Acidimicrobiales bacterium]
MLSALLGLHVATAAVAVCAGRRLGRRVWLVSGLAPLAVIVWLASNATVVGDGGALGAAAAWVPALGLTFDLRLDAFSALMVVLVSGIGVLVNVYAWRYFGDSDDTPRAAGLLTLFAGSMFGVVVADNLLALFVFWELTSVTSYLLIGLHDADRSARAAAQRALLTTGLGGLAMLGGFVLLGQQAGTFRLSEILTVAPSGTVTVVALVLVLAGAFTKSAQYPFHFWLPGAMVAPTPISAYLHSAAMVKAGVYLVARFAPAFAAVGPWRPLVVGVGLVTMVAGGLRALRPFDLKQLLAFGTISQLGFLMVMFGIGKPGATAAGCALLLAHSLFKAALFMVVGIVDHETHTRDLREMPVLGPGWATIRTVAAVSAASMAAVPPLAGFVAKEQAYTALVDGSTVDRFVLVGLVAGSILTVAYSIRFAIALLRPGLLHREDRPRRVAPAGPSGWFIAPAALLTAGSVILGIAPGSWSGFVEQAAQALDAAANIRLELWHGLSVPFVLSVCTLVSGVGLFALG